MKKRNVVSLVVAIIVSVIAFMIGNYLCIPRVGWSFGMLFLIAISIGFGLGAAAIYDFITEEYNDYDSDACNVVRNIIMGVLIGILVLAIIISLIVSWTWFHVDDAKSRISMTTITREELMEKLPDVDESGAYSWVDSETAKKLASRKTGELTELVSIYTASSNVSTTVTNGKLIKYVPLEYGGFFKSTKSETIPGYISIDPVSQKTEYVECGIKYSPSAYFDKDLMRHLRNNYPSDYLGNCTFQVAPDGTPYWVCELRKSCGSWFVLETYAVSLVNAQTGECTKYAIDDVPDWVMAIYGDTAMEYYNSYGTLINGYWNLSKAGETSTTDDFGYVAIDGVLYYYTGVTSAVVDGGDESNLGVLLYNAHTNKAEYCQIAGAEEYSAMEAAEGVVQNFGYKASFPSLTSVDGELTYTMVLKDSNGIVKQYAMVNYNNYTIAVTAATMNSCRVAYNKAVAKSGVADNDSSNWTEIEVVVADIEYIVQGGETTVYIRDTENKLYKASFDERFLFAKSSDTLILQIVDDSYEIKMVVYSNLVKANDADEIESETTVDDEIE